MSKAACAAPSTSSARPCWRRSRGWGARSTTGPRRRDGEEQTLERPIRCGARGAVGAARLRRRPAAGVPVAV
jgi:hypothetical protein